MRIVSDNTVPPLPAAGLTCLRRMRKSDDKYKFGCLRSRQKRLTHTRPPLRLTCWLSYLIFVTVLSIYFKQRQIRTQVKVINDSL